MTAYQPISGHVRAVPQEAGRHRLFLLIAPLLYVAYALLTPPFQTPDEHQHLFRAWQLSEFRLVGERRGDASGGVLPSALGQAALPEIGSLEPHASYRPVIQRPFGRDRATPLEPDGQSSFYDFRGSVIYSPAGYVPQVLAIWIGKAGDLSIENIVRLGRLLNAALSIFLISRALRVTPVGASAFLFIGLLPMTAAASAAFGQDGLVIGGACLITATGLRMALGERSKTSDVLVTALFAILLTLSKVFYLPLALIGGRPISGKRIELHRLLPSLAICLVAAILTAGWLVANSRAVVAPWPDIPPAAQTLAKWHRHPMEFPALLERTYIGHGSALFGSLFMFGWLNVAASSAAVFLTLIALGLVFLAGEPGARRLPVPMRLWLFGSALLVWFLISLVAGLYWTPASMASIPGLQGRYFIPIAPAILIALVPARKAATTFTRLLPVMMIGANLAALASIARAFYTF